MNTVLVRQINLNLSSGSQAIEVEESLLRTKEELHVVMTSTTITVPVVVESPAPVSGSVSSSSSSSDSESEHEHSDHEHSEENSTYSAELHMQEINDHRYEEDRITEAEKNERLQRQLLVSSRSQDTVHPSPSLHAHAVSFPKCVLMV